MSSLQEALDAFTASPELVRLESLLKRFNLFEAVGVVQHELRHSDFLAFLLDPSQNHGLGTIFLRKFLHALHVKEFDVDSLNLNQAYVLREWHHIDILVLDEVNRVAVLIENKIGTGEHSDQLNRYYNDFHSFYPGYQLIALYLTPDGDLPISDTNHVYHAVSYTLVCEIVEQVVQDNRAVLSSEIVMALEHYAQMLRRHIVSDSDFAKLCRSIYQQHKQALDLIIKHIPDQPALIGQYVKSLIHQQTELKEGGSGRNHVAFSLHEWQNSKRHRGEFGENISWILYFGFNYIANGLRLDLMIAPGDAVERQKHLQMAQKHRFRGYASRLTNGYSQIASVKFLNASDYEKTQDEIEVIISEKWAEYLRDEFPRIVQAVRDEKWLWELPPGE